MLYNDSDHDIIINLRLQPDTQRGMRPCPFCGHKPELQNTHTPSYWLACTGCRCELHDPRSARGDGMRSHRASALRVIEAWNHRWASK